MTKPKKTVLTFAVKIDLPAGSNAHEMQLFLRDAITGWSRSIPADNVHSIIAPESFTVALHEKKVTYA